MPADQPLLLKPATRQAGQQPQNEYIEAMLHQVAVSTTLSNVIPLVEKNVHPTLSRKLRR